MVPAIFFLGLLVGSFANDFIQLRAPSYIAVFNLFAVNAFAVLTVLGCKKDKKKGSV